MDLTPPPTKGSVLSKSQEKRLEKKSKRKGAKLASQEQGPLAANMFSSVPTEILCIQNGGAACNVRQDLLEEHLAQFGESKTFLPLAKPYALVTFQTIPSAQSAKERMHGAYCESLQRTLLVDYATEAWAQNLLKDPEGSGGDGDEELELAPGVMLYLNVISEEEEEQILDLVHSLPWRELSSRRIQHYGYEFIYGSNAIDVRSPITPIPELIRGIVQKLDERGLFPFSPDQLTVNEYHPGTGIAPHVDSHVSFEDGISSISLGSDVVMEFRSPKGEIFPGLLPRRSLLVMSGIGRYVYSHGISPRKSDALKDGLSFSRGTRVSLTLRKAREGPCTCDFPEHCPSRVGKGKDESKS